MKRFRSVVFIWLMLGLIAAWLVIDRRTQVEKLNNRVEIAVDWEEALTLAFTRGASGDPVPLLKALKSSGATSVAVTEITVADLINSGQIVPGAPSFADGVYSCKLEVADRATLAMLKRRLIPLGIARTDEDGVLITRMPVNQLLSVPVGFRSDAVDAANAAGMNVIARARNYPLMNEESLQLLAEDLQAMRVKSVIFAGDEVMGWRGGIDDTAIALRASGLVFGSVEFGKQKGSEKLEAKLKGRYIRVHSIGPSEMANYLPDAAVERYVRAARERNIRLLYVRLLTTTGPSAVEDNTDYIGDIRNGLIRSGLITGAAVPIGDPIPRKWELLAMACAVAAAFILAVDQVIAIGLGTAIAGFVLGIAVFGACALAGDLGRKVIAFGAALGFPTWAILAAARQSGVGGEADMKPGLANLLAAYLAPIVVAACGGIIIAGCLSGRIFMTQTDRFMGVKLAHLLPILAVFLLAVFGTLGRRLPWGELRREADQSLRTIWGSPVLFGYAIVGMVSLAMLLVVVIRSGNDAGVGVSSMELRFRALLDQILYVRPRTKEIFLGFPALMAAIWLSAKGEKSWARVLYVAAAVGLVSMVNTFCHVHSPFEMSAIRAFNGVWVGGLIGLSLVLILGTAGVGRRTDG